MNTKKFFRGPLFWIIIAVLLVLLGSNLVAGLNGPKSVSTAEAVTSIQTDQVKSATLVDREQRIRWCSTTAPRPRPTTSTARAWSCRSSCRPSRTRASCPRATTLRSPGQPLPDPARHLAAGDPHRRAAVLLHEPDAGRRIPDRELRQVQGQGAQQDMPQTTFADVAGADEAVEELQEIKEFLAEPTRFQAVGPRSPRRAALRTPGTGKTLLARAVAGEAGFPFYPSRARTSSRCSSASAPAACATCSSRPGQRPAIIFIDEIDAVGRHRGAGLGGGHDEREQTLNQMLVEMDGFDVTGGAILIAATNRPDILDPALLRPGRFDRQIAVERPDLEGRDQILKVHAKGKPMADHVDLRAVARRTPASPGGPGQRPERGRLLTAREGRQQIDDAALDEAIDRVLAGPQKRTRLMNDHERRITAYHEGGHALVARRCRTPTRAQDHDPAARARAGLHHGAARRGEVLHHPQRMLDQLAYMLGRPGRRGDGLPRPHHRRRERHRRPPAWPGPWSPSTA